MKNFFLLFLLLAVLLIPWLAFAAETDCPFGYVNDSAPGDCARYVDTNENDICDLSEVPLASDYGLSDKSGVDYLSEEELKEKTVKEVAEIYGIETGEFRAALSEFLTIDVKSDDSLGMLHDTYGLCSGVAANIALGVKNSQGIAGSPAESSAISQSDPSTQIVRYQFLPVTAALVILYLITHISVLRQKLKILTMRRVWNAVLLLSFLASSALGLLLIIRINWGYILPLPFDMLYWHVEIGTVMAVVSIFHVIWHWRYYTRIFHSKKSGKSIKYKV